MPRILWLRSGGRTGEADYLETGTGLKVAVSTGAPSTWEDLAQRVQVILMELPLASQIVKRCMTEAGHSRPAIPVIIYDPECTLEELLIGPPVGEFRHITEPLTPEQLLKLVSLELERSAQLASDAANTKEPWRDLIIGESRPMQLLHSMIRLVGPRRSTVLITGETGTGKEMVARAVHMASSRAGSKMVSVNCAAIPENLVESELFGHNKGAFTGAVNDRIGRFEQAHRGTIFLDEVGEIPIDTQPKLLRVLQERELQRVGGSNDIQIDTRVIAASNQDLEQAVADRRFREDLLYRLNVVPIVLPPLRERASDIPLLADHFIEKLCRREGFRPKTLSPDAVRRLMAHEWPGNVRQLEHAIEMAVALSGERERLYSGDIRISEPRRNSLPAAAEINLTQEGGGLNLEKMVGRVEQLLIQEALRQCGGNKAKAASSLGIPRTTLVYKLRSLEACA
jgi:DNA-binding NtrC family response regulator